MKPSTGIADAIGNTPLIRLSSLSAATGCEIFGKAEFMNPGGSVKDRTALAIVQDAEAKGLLKPGSTIVEGTAGNTGIGLTLLGNKKGYKTIVIVPVTQSQEKIDLLRTLGAEVKIVPAAKYTEKEHFNQVAKRLAESTPGAFWANQFDNPANLDVHYRTTGPEIWEQTQAQITGFVASVGTGGTLAGVSRFLKEMNPQIRVACPDPAGSAMYSWVKTGTALPDPGESITEGVGQKRLTGNVAQAQVDEAYRISDAMVVEMVYYLLRYEGLFLGSSSALNVCGAVKLALEGGRGQTIVTLLCDGGSRYLSKLFNPQWLAPRGLAPKARGNEFIHLI